MEGLARESDAAVALAVGRIADERVADRAQVHADLVGAAGFEPAAQQGGVGVALEHLVMRHCRPSARDHRHLRARDRVAADRRVDLAVARDAAVHHREVLALDAARLELAHEIGLRGQGLRHDQQAAGVLVEPMHDAGARHAGERGAWRSRALSSVPCQLPLPGCTTSPAGLLMTSRSRPRTRCRAECPPRGARAFRDPARGTTSISSPPRTFCRGCTARPSSVARPAFIHSASRLREYSGNNCASAWSNRRPAQLARHRQLHRRRFGSGCVIILAEFHDIRHSP